jgi:hypothetical protein
VPEKVKIGATSSVINITRAVRLKALEDALARGAIATPKLH